MAKKVLVVDDIVMNRAMLRSALSKDYDILEAVNGEEALAIMGENADTLSAVLLDILMPVMDGYEVLTRMRNDLRLAEIPVIIITGMEDDSARVKALSLGANDFVAKPYNPDIIRHCLRNNIALRETASMVNAMQRDKLTGLYNREVFFDRVSAVLEGKAPGSYIMACFDMDRFKLINDRYGTAEGDQVLRCIGTLAKKELFALGGVVGRISADNFAALYPAEYKDIDFVAKIQDQQTLPGELKSAVFSVGRYIVTDMTLSPSALYDRAYIAKQSVKGRYDEHIAYFDETMLDNLVRNQQIVAEMGAALAAGQFEIWFQPQYNHSTGALIGAEALVRWRHPAKGLIPPGVFIPIFEQNGFVYELDKYVWEEACRHLRKWIDEGRSPLPISVNISRYDIFRADLIEVITGLTQKYGISVDLLRLEITESAFATSASQIISVIRRLLDLGFTVEIDDFGSGYSSLNTLKDVPAQVLKLDMRFLESTENSQRGGNIVESIVRMAKWLDMSVIAEGVETIEQANFLKSIGCSYVQGYLYARPMPAPEYEALAKGAAKEERLLKLETVENLDNNAFWDPGSMDTLIFNSYVGGACIFEYQRGRIEILRATDKFIKLIGNTSITMEEALKLNWASYLTDESRAAAARALESSILHKEEISGEYVMTGLPGCDHDVYLQSSMRVIASAGNRYLVYCTNESITALRQAERRERRISEQLQAILANINGGVTASVIRDGSVRFLFASERYFEQLGYTRERFEAEVSDVFALVHPDDRQRVISKANQASAYPQSYTIEYRVVRPGGAVRWLQSNITMITFPGVDEPVQLSVANDITAERDARQELYETDRRLEFLNETAHDLLAQPDSDKGIEATLGKLLAHFDGDRAYVFEFDHSRGVANNTYEVCAKGVSSEKLNLQSVPMSIMSFWLNAFSRRGFVDIQDVNALDESRGEEKSTLMAQGVQSLIAVPLQRDGLLIGFIGVDDPRRQHSHVDRLVALGDYIAVMLTRRDLNAKIKSDNETLTSLMNDMPGGFVRMRVRPDGGIVPVYFNQGFQKLVGMNHDELMALYADSSFAGVHPDDVRGVREDADRVLAFGEAHSSRYRLRHGNGGYIWIMFFGRATLGEAGDTFLNIFYTDSIR